MIVATAHNPGPVSVVTELYVRTKALHLEAERTGVIRDLLRGEASLECYILLLRNLLPAYQALEQGLDRHSGSHALTALAKFRLDRASAIESDLAALCSDDWSSCVPLLTAGEAYAKRVLEAAEGDGTRLIAHAYTRYLGDLSGGQILRRLLTRSLALRSAQLTFYDFPQSVDLASLKADYRKAIDDAGALAPDPRIVIEEGAIAFTLNIDLSCAIQAMLPKAAPAVAMVE